MTFSEDSRVKIPSLLHLARLGYDYLSKDDAVWDESTNIFPDSFQESLLRINPDAGLTADDVKRLSAKIALLLDYEDMGEAFYARLPPASRNSTSTAWSRPTTCSRP